jgi:hypothetical protein
MELVYKRNHEQMFTLAESLGWKRWGNFTKKKGSSYQCFRKGNRYIWIGYAFIENCYYGHALPYQWDTTSDEEVLKFLT